MSNINPNCDGSHCRDGYKEVRKYPSVGGADLYLCLPCFANAMNDAFKFLGTTHIAMPHDHWRTWTVADKLGLHA